MSEHRSKVGSGRTNSEPGSSSANGTIPEDAVGALDGSADAATGNDSEAAIVSPTAAEFAGEPSGSATPDEGSAFMAELVGAMQSIVDLERVRIAENTERRRQAHIDLIKARDEAEAARLRAVAAHDTTSIKTWVDVETKRIQREGERRQKEVQEDLQTSIVAHRSTFDGAIQAVETKISTYRADVETFFSSLEGQTDVVQIAQQAARRPEFPTLDPVPETVASQAEAASAATDDTDAGDGAGTPDAGEPAAVGVMDSESATEPAESWTASDETTPAAEGTEGEESLEPEPEPEPVGVGAGSSQSSSGSLFQTVPALRPMSSWLRRDPNGEDLPHRGS